MLNLRPPMFCFVTERWLWRGRAGPRGPIQELTRLPKRARNKQKQLENYFARQFKFLSGLILDSRAENVRSHSKNWWLCFSNFHNLTTDSFSNLTAFSLSSLNLSLWSLLVLDCFVSVLFFPNEFIWTLKR